MMLETLNTRVLIIDDEEIVRDNIEDILIPNHLLPNERVSSAASILFGGTDSQDEVLVPTLNRNIPVFTVDKAVNGMEGVDMIRQSIAEENPYAVIFLDMRMPGWDGLETAMYIREVDPKAEIIIITAYSDRSIEEIVEKAGQNIGYHCKPYASEEILQLATKAVNDYNKLRNLEKLISAISNINVSQTHLNSLLQNILDQLSMYIGSHSALIGKLNDAQEYEPLFSIGSIEKEINIYKISEIISSAKFNQEEVEQIGDVVFVKLEGYSIFAVISREFHLKTERLYLLKLFVHNAAKAIKNIQLQEELIKKEKLSAVGKALGMLMHDLRTPIKSIPYFTDLIRQEGIESEWLGLIDQCGQQASEIFDDFLDFLKEAPLQLQPVIVSQLIKESITLTRGRLNLDEIVIQEKLEPGLLVMGDKNKLKRAIMNLISNAIEACKEYQVSQPTIRITATRSGSQVILTIHDNGPGIPDALLHTLFDAFVTANKTNGTGLGLAIVRQSIQAHGGTISVCNDQGACFTLRLPLAC